MLLLPSDATRAQMEALCGLCAWHWSSADVRWAPPISIGGRGTMIVLVKPVKKKHTRPPHVAVFSCCCCRHVEKAAIWAAGSRDMFTPHNYLLPHEAGVPTKRTLDKSSSNHIGEEAYTWCMVPLKTFLTRGTNFFFIFKTYCTSGAFFVLSLDTNVQTNK